jgi:hypothetical protein
MHFAPFDRRLAFEQTQIEIETPLNGVVKRQR